MDKSGHLVILNKGREIKSKNCDFYGSDSGEVKENFWYSLHMRLDSRDHFLGHMLRGAMDTIETLVLVQ